MSYYSIFNKATGRSLKVGYEGEFVVANFTDKEFAEEFVKKDMLDPWMEDYEVLETEEFKDLEIAKEGDPVSFSIVVINRDRSIYRVDFKDIYYGIYMGESIEPLESQAYRTSQTVSFQYGKEKELLS